MKKLRISILLISSFIILDLDAQEAAPSFESNVTTQEKPWTHLDFYNDPNQFQFAIVTDRTGGLRPGIFAQAVHKLNGLMPEFVVSVGDLIEGYTRDREQMDKEWHEFDSILAPLKAPFFRLPGNHDIIYPEQRTYWLEKYGVSYYHFVYKDVLFFMLDSNEGQGTEFSDEQVAYIKQTLEENKNVRWTLMLMHHPLWTYGHETNFQEVEEALSGRGHTVIAGHQHTYRHFSRNNNQYYTLATTGGGSSLLGPKFGKFDHVTWVTMMEDGPQLTNLKLDGILADDVTNDDMVALGRELVKSTAFEYKILTPTGADYDKGWLQLSVSNDADVELQLKGKFYHNHYVRPSILEIDEKVAPKTTKAIEIDLSQIQHYDFVDMIQLELDWSMDYTDKSTEGLALNGTLPITIRPSAVNTMTPRYVELNEPFELRMSSDVAGGTIRYTLDGTEPTVSSKEYTGAFTVGKPAMLKAKVFSPNGFSSLSDSTIFAKPKVKGSGLICEYYEYTGNVDRWRKLPDFSKLTPVKKVVVNEIDPQAIAEKRYYYAAVFKGQIDIPESGTYTFYTNSDDGSKLYVDGHEVVNNDATHGAREERGEIKLEKGKYPFEVQYFQDRSGGMLEVFMQAPGESKKPLPIHILSTLVSQSEE